MFNSCSNKNFNGNQPDIRKCKSQEIENIKCLLYYNLAALYTLTITFPNPYNNKTNTNKDK